MADFVLPERRIPIELVDGDYDGAEITADIRVPMAVLREYDVLVADDKINVSDFLARAGDLFFQYGRPTWNLADAAGGIPATREGFDRIDWQTQRAIVNGWMRGVANPPRPLSLPSGSTAPSRARRRSPKS